MKKKEKVKFSEHVRERIEKGEFDAARLSKIARFMLEHPGGIGTVVDRRAVNR